MNQLSKVFLKGIAIGTRSWTPALKFSQETKIPTHLSIAAFKSTQFAPLIPVEKIKSSRQAQTSGNVGQTFKETIGPDFLEPTIQFTNQLSKTADLTPFKGLPNLGNTCFVASVVQASLLFQKDRLKESLATASPEDQITIRAILNWIQSYENAKDTVSLAPLLSILSQHRIYNGHQEDAAEFLTWLNNYLPSSSVYFQRETKTAPLSEGQRVLEEEANQSEIVREIPLDVQSEWVQGERQMKPGQTLLSLLKKFFSSVDVSSQDAYLERYVIEASGQMNKQRIPILERQEKLSAAPKELTLQIKKFTRDDRLGGELADVPETFVMPKEYCANGEEATYKLRSVISHLGSSRARGHYIAYVRKGEEYICANDGAISKIDRESMLQAAREGYILIYDKVAQQ